jgi:hypothetical protein
MNRHRVIFAVPLSSQSLCSFALLGPGLMCDPDSLMWGVAGVPLGAYSLIQRLNTPLVVQPQLFMAFCMASWAQCEYYGRKRGKLVCVGMYLSVLAGMGAVEVGLVYAVRVRPVPISSPRCIVLMILASLLTIEEIPHQSPSSASSPPSSSPLHCCPNTGRFIGLVTFADSPFHSC